jgi:hypothetical protein
MTSFASRRRSVLAVPACRGMCFASNVVVMTACTNQQIEEGPIWCGRQALSVRDNAQHAWLALRQTSGKSHWHWSLVETNPVFLESNTSVQIRDVDKEMGTGNQRLLSTVSEKSPRRSTFHQSLPRHMKSRIFARWWLVGTRRIFTEPLPGTVSREEVVRY